jgi:hypothetical protein
MGTPVDPLRKDTAAAPLNPKLILRFPGRGGIGLALRQRLVPRHSPVIYDS